MIALDILGEATQLITQIHIEILPILVSQDTTLSTSPAEHFHRTAIRSK